jgi:hypothetical protein
MGANAFHRLSVRNEDFPTLPPSGQTNLGVTEGTGRGSNQYDT